MKTKTEIRKEKDSRKPLGKPRNVGVKRTIQQLKEEHKLAGGSFFGPHVRTHGHPQGSLFVASVRRFGQWEYRVHSAAGEKCNDAAGPFLTHAGALNAMQGMK